MCITFLLVWRHLNLELSTTPLSVHFALHLQCSLLITPGFICFLFVHPPLPGESAQVVDSRPFPSIQNQKVTPNITFAAPHM